MYLTTGEGIVKLRVISTDEQKQNKVNYILRLLKYHSSMKKIETNSMILSKAGDHFSSAEGSSRKVEVTQNATFKI